MLESSVTLMIVGIGSCQTPKRASSSSLRSDRGPAFSSPFGAFFVAYQYTHLRPRFTNPNLSPTGEAHHDAAFVLFEARNLGAKSYRLFAQRRVKRLLEVRPVHDPGDAPEPLLHRGGRQLVKHLPVRGAQLAFRAQGPPDRQHRLVQAELL